MFPDKKKEGKKSAQTIKSNIRQLHLCWWCRWQRIRWLRGTIWLRMWVNPGFTPYFPDHMPSLVITLPNTEIHYSTTWTLRIIKGAQVAARTNSKVSFQHKVTLVRSGRKPPSGITKGSFLRSFVTHDSWGFEKTLGDSSRWFSKEIAKEIPRKTKFNLFHYLFPFDIGE